MQILNYKNHNATQIAEELINSAPDYNKADCKNMTMVDRVKFTIDRWSELNPKANKNPEQRKILKHLCTALAYMGDSCAATRMEMLAHFDAEYAKEIGDADALARAKEEQVFWQTVLYMYANAKGDSIHLAYALLYGMGCERDIDRAREIYERKLFERYEALDENNRSRLRDARDGKFTCPMPEMRKRTIDALLNGDHDQFKQVFNEAVEQGTERDVDSVWGMMSYLDKLKEKAS